MTDGFMGRWIIETGPRPAFYLDRRSTNARRIFSALDVDLVDDPARAHLLWLRRGFEQVLPYLGAGQLVNHFVNEGAMINKGRLTVNLNAAGDVDFYPESYRLYDAVERSAFFARLETDPAPDPIWILKPAHLSRGIGIRIFRKFDGLRRQFVDGDRSDPVVDPRLDYIAQRYIAEPLLLEGKKSELRIYWMIASLEPLRVLMFDEGTVRLTSADFSLDDLDDTLAHVTNTYQQKKHSDGGLDATLKWTFADLQRYLGETRDDVAPDHVESVLKPELRELLRRVVAAVYRELRQTGTVASCFGVYGADVILDGDLKPWLTEIQKNPGLSHDDPVKIRVVPKMLREAVAIALAVETGDWEDLPKGFDWVVAP